ncbi:uncharacterized protein LOC114314035 [Camellia sinensis]|uniref:uncharacterized protein LOC114314035 n=1 Tax=Camellia sinensis TaxID=4442 RepID=UPI00103687AF|nr:uncharacterized protein LOC114314035 [Camellia sinensis]
MAIKNAMDSSRIEMLNENNFRAWKHHISYLLTHEKTFHTLSTSKPDDDSNWFQRKWIEDDAMAKATMLHNMKDNIIPLFEEHETARQLMEALESKYGVRSNTQIQLLLDKYNNTRMSDNDSVGDHVNLMKLIGKELSNAGHFLSNKMQVTIILSSLPLSWDHVITYLTHSGREISMVTLLVLLVLEEERMKRRRKEAMVLEPSSNSWWIDSVATRHIVQNKDMFMEFTDKKVGEHRIYMGNNSYSDVLSIGNCQFSINGTSIMLHDVLYKSKAIEKFKEYKLEVEKQLGQSIKHLNNDRGGKYETIDSFCKDNGIKHVYNAIYTTTK